MVPWSYINITPCSGTGGIRLASRKGRYVYAPPLRMNISNIKPHASAMTAPSKMLASGSWMGGGGGLTLTDIKGDLDAIPVQTIKSPRSSPIEQPQNHR